MIPQFPAQFPGHPVGFVDSAGALTTAGRNFLQALLDRTGQANGIANQVHNALAATGATQETALQLNLDTNEVVATPPGAGVLLKDLQPGQIQVVFNGGANALKVYPPSGAQINALGADTAHSLAPGKTQYYTAYAPSQFRTVALG